MWTTFPKEWGETTNAGTQRTYTKGLLHKLVREFLKGLKPS